MGQLADVVPIDVAVGWGEMSDSAVLEQLRISQSNRFYFWRYDEDEPPIPRESIERQSANWHLIPATESMWSVLQAVRVGDVVQLTGRLVDIDSSEGQMRTSLTRGDTGAGACEILLVEAVNRRPR